MASRSSVFSFLSLDDDREGFVRFFKNRIRKTFFLEQTYHNFADT
ncbi:hypothetical protein [Cyclonatronum sp.]|nr:hypothetical protein [Cyclonatronum sp.]